MVLIRLQRWLRGLGRPPADANRRALAARGESPADFRIRDLREEEISALAELHAITWSDTYPMVLRPPTAALREAQWRATWAQQDGSWFCLVVEAPEGQLVGFAHGKRYAHPGGPPYGGELSKIYLLKEHQRLGLGRRMMGEVARRFLGMGITSMLLFADEGNPTCLFYEALGGHNLPNADGTLNRGNYGWHDIHPLAELE
jgi:GNAT superfamily N-acetyltransferase